MEKTGFGIIGAGMISELHVQAIQTSQNCRLVGVYDAVPEFAARRAEQFNCKSYRNFEEFLSDREIEAVTIATPSGAHLDMVVAAAKAGKHIFCEKPLEITLERVDEMLKVCRENNVMLMPVFQNRFSKPVQVLRKAVQEGKLGKMIFAGGQMHWFRNDDYYNRSKWRGTWAMDGGGALMNQAIHMIDMLIYINGSPAEVCGMSGTMTHDIEVEDTLCAAIKWENGSFGTIEVSTSCGPGFPRRLEFAGSCGSVAFEEDKISRWEFAEESAEDEEIRRIYCGKADAAGGSNPTNINCDGHRLELDNLADAIRNGTPLLIDGSEGRRAVELICGIYESVRSGKKYIFS